MQNKNKPHVLTLHPAKGEQYNATTEQEMNVVGQRIAQARNNAGLSLVKFSSLLEQFGVSVSSVAINKWEHGKNVPSAYQLLAISRALQLEDDLSYFIGKGRALELNEEGMRKVADYKADLIASGRYKPVTAAKTTIRYIEMPVSNLAVSAGTGEFLDEGNFEMISFPESSVPSGAEFGLRVSGDSMEPVYHDGQIVWVQQCEAVGVGEVGVFIYDGEGYLKMYDEQMPSEADCEELADSYGRVPMQPVMVSYNKSYAPKVVSVNARFQVVGRVL